MAASLLVTDTGQAEPPARDSEPLTVWQVIDQRAVLAGQEVVVEGFLQRRKGFYLLKPGKRRPPGSLGEHGERFWCHFDRGPGEWRDEIWLKSIGPWLARKIPAGYRGETYWQGRQVIIRGKLDHSVTYDSIFEVTTGPMPEIELRRKAYGPLRDAKILKINDEYCWGHEPRPGIPE